MDLLASMLAHAVQTRGGEEPKMETPLPEAQRDELTLMLADHARRHKFQRGDFVRWKRGFGPVMHDWRQKMVFVYWRPIGPPGGADDRWRTTLTEGERISLDTPDCLVGYLQNGTIVFDPACEAMLEPAP